jgi:hypothetical protein
VPIVITVDGFSVAFFSNEGMPREPLHVHIRKGEFRAKVWIEPEIRIAEEGHFNSRDLQRIVTIVRENELLIRRRWLEHFGS